MEPASEQKLNFEKQYFDKFRSLVTEHTGIKLAESKVDMVYRRFAPRLKKLGLNDFGEYYEILQGENPVEILEFSNLITTNLTSFFREKHHFEYLSKTAFPQMLARKVNSRRLRVWSAGCSTGEEPYSIAITLKESIPDIHQWDARILATDLDTNCLERAKAGSYPVKGLEGVSAGRQQKWFDESKTGELTLVQAKPELKSLIAFKYLNLMRPLPFSGQFDIIFCRNVMIYFDKATQKELIDKYAAIQSPGDLLIIGHSENIGSLTNDYSLIGNTIYQRV